MELRELILAHGYTGDWFFDDEVDLLLDEGETPIDIVVDAVVIAEPNTLI